MKPKIVALLLAHTIAVITALLGDASIATLVTIYIIQTFIFIVAFFAYSVMTTKGLFRLHAVIASSMMAFFSLLLVVLFNVMMNQDSIIVNGVSRPNDLGTITLSAVVTGSIAFFFEQLRYIRTRSIHKKKSELITSFYIYISNFTRLVATFVIMAFAFTIGSSPITIIIIGMTKFGLDVAMIFFDRTIRTMPNPTLPAFRK